MKSTKNWVDDIISCSLYTRSLQSYEKDEKGLLLSPEEFVDMIEESHMAWTTPYGKIQYGLPLASVVLGFIYNKSYFKANGFVAPNTTAKFFQLLEDIKTKGDLTPMAIGTYEEWAVAE